MKVLVTGFDPFGGETINPAYEAVKKLPDLILNSEIIKMEIPTEFSRSISVLKYAIDTYHPDVVLNVGQAGGRASISLERVAINLADARIPDNAGKQPVDTKLIENGENAYFTNLPVKVILQKIRSEGIACDLSYSAGTYVCNCVMYHVLHWIATEYPQMKGGFIHVPYVEEQTKEKPVGTSWMRLEDIAKGLELAIAEILK